MLRIEGLEIDVDRRTDISWVLRKNPYNPVNEKGGFKKSVGSGVYRGYYPVIGGEVDPHTFIIEFNPTGKKEEVGDIEQFPIRHITHPSILSGCVTNLLASAWKTPIEEETNGEHNDGPVKLEFFIFSNKSLTPFGVNIRDSMYMAKHIIQHFPSLFEGLNWLLALTTYLSDEYISKEDLIKAAKNCNNGKLGYHPRYLLSKEKDQSEIFSTEDIHLAGGNTSLQRRREIQKELEGSTSSRLIDLGAGSLYVTKKLLDQYESIIAVDKEFSNKTKIKAKEMEILLEECNILEWKGDYDGADIILSEVLEHNSLEEAKNILNKVLEGKPNKVIITVPNRQFNVNFGGYEEGIMRHDDHKWEPSMEEFKEMLPEIEGYNLSTKGIGDRVGDQYISLMGIYKLKGESNEH